jgi:hypothetical protein
VPARFQILELLTIFSSQFKHFWRSAYGRQ